MAKRRSLRRWHGCQRWTRRLLPCPYWRIEDSLEDHERRRRRQESPRRPLVQHQEQETRAGLVYSVLDLVEPPYGREWIPAENPLKGGQVDEPGPSVPPGVFVDPAMVESPFAVRQVRTVGDRVERVVRAARVLDERLRDTSDERSRLWRPDPREWLDIVPPLVPPETERDGLPRGRPGAELQPAFGAASRSETLLSQVLGRRWRQFSESVPGWVIDTFGDLASEDWAKALATASAGATAYGVRELTRGKGEPAPKRPSGGGRSGPKAPSGGGSSGGRGRGGAFFNFNKVLQGVTGRDAAAVGETAP